MNEPMDHMINFTNHTRTDWDNGPTLHTRLIFVGAWILIAVAGIIGKQNVIF